MSNFTRPNDANHQDKPEDWLLSSLIFTSALGLIIPVGKGIVVEVKGDMKALMPDVNKVIVFATDDMITVEKLSDDSPLKEGDWASIINEEDISN